MEIVISLMLLAKIFLTLLAIGFFSAICLSPINDSPISLGQKITWFIGCLVIVFVIFNLDSFYITFE